MTFPVTISARTPGYDALMRTLIGARTRQAGTFNARTADRIGEQQAATRPDTNGGA